MQRLTKMEVLIVIDDEATSFDVLETIGARLGVEQSKIRKVLVSRIKAKLPRKDGEYTAVLEEDITANAVIDEPVRKVTRKPMSETDEEPSVRPEPKKQVEPGGFFNIRGPKLDKAMQAGVDEYVEKWNVPPMLKGILGFVAGLLQDMIQHKIIQREHISEEELNTILKKAKAEARVETLQIVLQVMNVLKSPSTADDEELKKVLGNQLATAAKTAGVQLNTKGETSLSSLIGNLMGSGEKHEDGKKHATGSKITSIHD